MNCSIRTCRNESKRLNALVQPGMCVSHAWLWVLRDDVRETRAEFVDRQEALDMMKGRTLRDERRAA